MTVTVVNFSVTISGTPTTGPPPLIVAFTSTLTGGTSPFVYQWRFGDGGLDAAANPSHTYTSPGSFKATLVVTDSTGRTAKSNTVSIQSKAPILLAASAKPYRVKINEVVPFRANASGGSGYFTTFAWTFGDGGTGTGSTPTHAYSTAGTYKAKVVVTDSTGATKTSPDVTVFVYGPVSASSITPTSASPGVAKTFGVTVTGGDGHYSYAWAFGDGGTATGATPTHTYSTAGTRTVSVTVTDGLGQTATTSRSLTVVNPPVITLMKKASPPFKITATGSNLQSGIKVYIKGVEWPSVTYKTTGKIIITGSTLKTTVPKGTPTLFRFVNPDGGEASLTWQW
jgi:PKD repeat protein